MNILYDIFELIMVLLLLSIAAFVVAMGFMFLLILSPFILLAVIGFRVIKYSYDG